MSFRLTVDLKDPGEGRNATGLLVPVAPMTEHQRLIGIEISGAATRYTVHDIGGRQRALFLLKPEIGPTCFTYNFEPGVPGATEMPACQEGDIGLPAAVVERLHRSLEGASSNSERERRVVDFAAQHFSYGPRADTPIAEQLACGLGEGNCIDINGFLVAALVSCGIPTHYYAGYYFPRRDGPSDADGMHCWISTHIDGERHYWDVPYSLKRGLIQIRPGLNHLGGTYIAMSVGLDLAFDIEGVTYRTKYLAQPSWLLPDGDIRPASVNSRARPFPDAKDVTVAVTAI